MDELIYTTDWLVVAPAGCSQALREVAQQYQWTIIENASTTHALRTAIAIDASAVVVDSTTSNSGITAAALMSQLDALDQVVCIVGAAPGSTTSALIGTHVTFCGTTEEFVSRFLSPHSLGRRLRKTTSRLARSLPVSSN